MSSNYCHSYVVEGIKNEEECLMFVQGRHHPFAIVTINTPQASPKPGYDSYPLAASKRESIRLLFALPWSSTACISSSIFCKNRSLSHTGLQPSLCVFSEMTFSLDIWSVTTFPKFNPIRSAYPEFHNVWTNCTGTPSDSAATSSLGQTCVSELATRFRALRATANRSKDSHQKRSWASAK